MHTMKCSVFIAASADGFIAKIDDSIDWLHTAGRQEVEMGDEADMGFKAFIDSVDCMIMGRRCMETIAAMNLPVEQWPYTNTRVIALSNALTQAPESLHGKVEIYGGEIPELMDKLEEQGFEHAYIDGGVTIQNFINLKLINQLCITQVPVLIGQGKPLFGPTFKDIKLQQPKVTVYPNDYVQFSYRVNYD